MKPLLRDWRNGWLGWRGERAAARFLRRAGLRVLIQGFRARGGEIDLIVRDGNSLVFVEVKTRRRGQPAEAVTPEKQRRLSHAAYSFLRKYRLLEPGVPCRFDIVAVVWPEGRGRCEIQHLRNAFEVVGDG